MARTASPKARLVKDLKDGASNIRDDVFETGDKVKGDLQALARDAGKKARKYVAAHEQTLTGATQTVAELIREKPVQSGLIAAGLGFVLGMLVRRK